MSVIDDLPDRTRWAGMALVWVALAVYLVGTVARYAYGWVPSGPPSLAYDAAFVILAAFLVMRIATRLRSSES